MRSPKSFQPGATAMTRSRCEITLGLRWGAGKERGRSQPCRCALPRAGARRTMTRVQPSCAGRPRSFLKTEVTDQLGDEPTLASAETFSPRVGIALKKCSGRCAAWSRDWSSLWFFAFGHLRPKKFIDLFNWTPSVPLHIKRRDGFTPVSFDGTGTSEYSRWFAAEAAALSTQSPKKELAARTF